MLPEHATETTTHRLAISPRPLLPALVLATARDVTRELVGTHRPRAAWTYELDGVALRRPAWDELGGRGRRRHAVLDRLQTPVRTSRPPASGAIRRSWSRPTVVCDFDPAALQGPLVLVTFHLGPLAAYAPIVRALRGDVAAPFGSEVVAARLRRISRGKLQIVTTANAQDRSAALIRLIRVVREGGFALVVADVAEGPQLPVTVLGRDVTLARGPFALARATRAPVMPMAMTWDGPRARLVHGPALRAGTELDAARCTAAWLDAHLRQHPSDVSSEVAGLLGVPPRPPARMAARLRHAA